MQIPFPKMHIAQSVLNRIANTLEEKGPLGLENKEPSLATANPPPDVPNPDEIGMNIDRQIATPTPPVAVPQGAEAAADDGMLGESIRGGSPFDGALIGAGM